MLESILNLERRKTSGGGSSLTPLVIPLPGRLGRDAKGGCLRFACALLRNRGGLSDASWRMFLEWIEYFGTIFGVEIRSVAPHFTSQDCSQCGHRQKKSLSQRTHQCVKCGDQLHRDHNAALDRQKYRGALGN